MNSQEILGKYLEFYKSRGHGQIPNVSLVPEGDSTLLFVNSGMFPLVPYLSGEPHPLGKRLVNVQRCIRLQDIDEVGDSRHTTAFHMIGNWSLGDYFKDEQLPWAYEFLIQELKLDPKKLFATIFAGDDSAPKDEEAIRILKEIFSKYNINAKENERIFAFGKQNNWWQRGEADGELGGPDSEIFYYLGEGDGIGKSPEVYEDEFFEIGNSVFMQYIKQGDKWEPLVQKNVDFGGGLERMAVAVQGKIDIFETDNFWPLIEKIQSISEKDYYQSTVVKRNMRILADHMRAGVFLAMDGVTPSNKDQGYILRRLIRRMVRAGKSLGVEKNLSVLLVGTVCDMLVWLYPELLAKRENIEQVFQSEEDKFYKTINSCAGIVKKISEKLQNNTNDAIETSVAQEAFDIYQSRGYPTEIFIEDIKDVIPSLDTVKVSKEISRIEIEHKEKSRAGMDKKFKGGLADNSEDVIRYHTTTHLLQRALKNVLGDNVRQLGSNLTSERLRFDFPYDTKISDVQIHEIENQVNGVIDQKLPVSYVMLPKDEAEKTGALFLKEESYPDMVKVYFIGNDLDLAISKEFCGGPHVSNTSEIPHVEIYKQESLGAGKLRIYLKFK